MTTWLLTVVVGVFTVTVQPLPTEDICYANGRYMAEALVKTTGATTVSIRCTPIRELG